MIFLTVLKPLYPYTGNRAEIKENKLSALFSVTVLLLICNSHASIVCVTLIDMQQPEFVIKIILYKRY